VEAAEQGGVPLRECRERRSTRDEHPDLVAVPDRTDGVDQDPTLGVVAREDGQKHAAPEVEPLEAEVADPQDGDEDEPDGGELHGPVSSRGRQYAKASGLSAPESGAPLDGSTGSAPRRM